MSYTLSFSISIILLVDWFSGSWVKIESGTEDFNVELVFMAYWVA